MRTVSFIPGFAAAVFVAAACDDAPTAPATGQAIDGATAVYGSAAERSRAPFQVVHEGFSDGTGLWSDAAVPGYEGWCGEIEQVDRGSGPVDPSAGHGYALASVAPCNAFWAAIFAGFPPTGPYGPRELAPPAVAPWFSSLLPPAGYVHDLDVYLDPEIEEHSFIYLVSSRVLDGQTPLGGAQFRYFAAFAASTPDGLSVNGHPIDEAGWYTMRFAFAQADGGLSVTFELRQDGRVLASDPVPSTFPLQAPPEDPATLDPGTVGSGYSWFLDIAPGLELPIDEQRIRPGS